jgi:hypothetical protein
MLRYGLTSALLSTAFAAFLVCAASFARGDTVPEYPRDTQWARYADAVRRGDVSPIRCFRKTYLRKFIGHQSARHLFTDNPDARSLCGTLNCHGKHCHFDALVFVDEAPKVRPAPPVQAKTRKAPHPR